MNTHTRILHTNASFHFALLHIKRSKDYVGANIAIDGMLLLTTTMDETYTNFIVHLPTAHHQYTTTTCTK